MEGSVKITILILTSAGISRNTAAGNDGVSVKYFNKTAVTITYPKNPGGYIAVILSNGSSEYYPLQFPGNSVYSTVIYNETTSCLSLFSQDRDNGILSSSKPISVFITVDATQGMQIYAIIVIAVSVVIVAVVAVAVTVLIIERRSKFYY